MSELDKFQKEMWASDKPLLYAVAFVEQLLEENRRLRAIASDLATQVRQEFNDELRTKVDFSNFEK